MGTTRKTLSIFWRESVKTPKYLLRCLTLWPVGICVQDLLLPLVAAAAINELVRIAPTLTPTTDYWALFMPYIWAFVAVAVIGQIIIYHGLMSVTRLQAFVRPRLEKLVFDHVTKQSMGFHANTFSGSLVNQSSKFAGGFISVSETTLISGVQLVSKTIVSIVIIAFFSPMIALAMGVWTVLFALLNIYLTLKRIPFSKRAASAESAVTAYLADAMGNIGVIKASSQEDRELRAYHAKALDSTNKRVITLDKAVRNGSLSAYLMSFIQLVIMVLSIYAIANHSIELGTLLLVNVYMAQLLAGLWNLGNITRTIERGLSEAADMTEILETEPEVKDVAKPQPAKITKGTIAVTGMDFTHGDAQQDDALFKNFGLHIKAGEKIGLVGHSGSGKTTLTRLLLRFSDVDAGTITIDGQDIRDIRQADLRQHIAYVPQEPLLFHRSIRENIAYSNPSATDAQVKEAARLAYADEFIVKLPKGYDTMVGERGVKLSGGQRQRIAIARAVIKDAPILILDEATSALDSESEKLIQQALAKLMKGRTTIVIAHRLSTIQKMDRIVVLADGAIIEQGAHNELLKKEGVYAGLWKHQSGGFIQE